MTSAVTPALDVKNIRRDFPILSRLVHGKPLAYLDNAATSQKPRAVLEALRAFYEEYNSNVHRAVHELSARATREYEAAREKIARFVNAAESREIVFTRGTTESINLVAQTWGRKYLGRGDEVVVTHMEHHSNIVPWQMLCEATGAALHVIPVTEEGALDRESFDGFITPRTRLVAVTHVSNVLGTVNPVDEIVRRAHRVGAVVLVDGAQAVPHRPVDVRALDADFYAFSGHKMCGPTGIGVLYGKAALLESMPPWQGGGDMIEKVSFEGTTYAAIPQTFEAGTPHIAGAIGLGAAADYLAALGMENILALERDLSAYAEEKLRAVPGLRILGAAPGKAAVVSFLIEGTHPHDVGAILDREGIAVRTGHHCAMPLMERFGLTAVARASFAFYNTREEVDRLVRALLKAKKLLK